MTNKTLTINTNLFPILDPGLYESLIGPTEMGERFWEQYESSDPRYEDNSFVYEANFDFDKYKELVLEIAKEIFDENMFEKYGLKLSLGEYYSPKEYNNSTDSIDIIVEFVNEKLFRKSLKNLIEDFVEIPKMWKSCDGFDSFMPQSKKDVINICNCPDYEDAQDMGAMLTLLAIKDEFLVIDYSEGEMSSLQEEFQERVYEDMLCGGYDECITLATMIPRDLANLYNNDIVLNAIFHGIVKEKGRLWSDTEMFWFYNNLGGDSSFTDKENDACQMLYWASQMGYNVDDLMEMSGEGEFLKGLYYCKI